MLTAMHQGDQNELAMSNLIFVLTRMPVRAFPVVSKMVLRCENNGSTAELKRKACWSRVGLTTGAVEMHWREACLWIVM